MMFECLRCGYIYDPREGAPAQGVSPGTRFDDLEDTFRCPSCRGPRDGWVPRDDRSTITGGY